MEKSKRVFSACFIGVILIIVAVAGMMFSRRSAEEETIRIIGDCVMRCTGNSTLAESEAGIPDISDPNVGLTGLIEYCVSSERDIWKEKRWAKALERMKGRLSGGNLSFVRERIINSDVTCWLQGKYNVDQIQPLFLAAKRLEAHLEGDDCYQVYPDSLDCQFRKGQEELENNPRDRLSVIRRTVEDEIVNVFKHPDQYCQ